MPIMSRDDVLQAALALAPEERISLSVDLLASVEPLEDGVAQSWEAELDRRADRLDRGDAVLVDGRAVLRDLDSGFPR